jgi:hypothetical protein
MAVKTLFDWRATSLGTGRSRDVVARAGAMATSLGSWFRASERSCQGSGGRWRSASEKDSRRWTYRSAEYYFFTEGHPQRTAHRLRSLRSVQKGVVVDVYQPDRREGSDDRWAGAYVRSW